MTLALSSIEVPVASCVCATAAVSVRGLGKTIDDRDILDDLTFEVPEGSFVALLGANGAGKSSLLKILATLIPPSRGELQLFGAAVRSDATALRSRIGLIGHAPMLYRDLSALENLILFGRLYGVADPRQRAEQLLDYVELSHRASDSIKTFSRGMVQRAAIARALMHDPDLLLADEPFSGLDAPSANALERLLKRLHDEGRTIILANHDLSQSLAIAQRAIVLRRGRLVMDAPVGDLTQAEILAEVSAT